MTLESGYSLYTCSEQNQDFWFAVLTLSRVSDGQLSVTESMPFNGVMDIMMPVSMLLLYPSLLVLSSL